MKKRNIFYLIILVLVGGNTACNFLDTPPDNRTELDSPEKVRKLLINAYTNRFPLLVAEMSSDNYDFKGTTWGNGVRLQEEYYFWMDPRESNNEGIKNLWGQQYLAIAHANMALETLDNMESTAETDALRGEALISRAYHHFLLANIFCQHYDSRYASTDLGIPYSDTPETTVNPQHTRGTLAQTYRRIEEDILEGLPLIDDNIYEVPKYHFNKKAAYAFATRFYLYTKQYDKVIEYANVVLGDNPESLLRDMSEFASMTQEYGPMANHYVLPKHPANLLLVTSFCNMTYLANYGNGKRYQTTDLIAYNETIKSNGPWGTYNDNLFYLRPLSYRDGYNLQPKFPYLFQTTDVVAGTGFAKTVISVFHTDEVLLARAEAHILKATPDYDAAVADLSLWLSRHTRNGLTLTFNDIQAFYGGLDYWDMDLQRWTPKKRLNPEVPFIDVQQENMIHCLLHIRRIETTGEGLRWYDIKRYNIEIHHRLNPDTGNISSLGNLKVRDNRYAIQLPQEVVLSGLEANPR